MKKKMIVRIFNLYYCYRICKIHDIRTGLFDRIRKEFNELYSNCILESGVKSHQEKAFKETLKNEIMSYILMYLHAPIRINDEKRELRMILK